MSEACQQVGYSLMGFMVGVFVLAVVIGSLSKKG